MDGIDCIVSMSSFGCVLTVFRRIRETRLSRIHSLLKLKLFLQNFGLMLQMTNDYIKQGSVFHSIKAVSFVGKKEVSQLFGPLPEAVNHFESELISLPG